MTEIVPSNVFVVLPIENNPTFFAKNSHRPNNEIQEIVYVKGGKRENDLLKCTYIEIKETDAPLNSIILSKPSWMWGAEMGSNDQNVCICNVALKSKYNADDADISIKRLLGTDLVRLGLERGKTAEGCVDVITELLEEYGQGGSYGRDDAEMLYHNSFVIVDPKEAWILETCGKFWAAEKLNSSYKHISNYYTIKTKMDKMSEGLKEKAVELKLWDGEGEFCFEKCFGIPGSQNDTDIYEFLETVQCDGFDTSVMFHILRNFALKICYPINEEYPTQGSQVSCLSDTIMSTHWFTGTPDPNVSVFKPFVFTPNARISQHTISNVNDPNLSHSLYNLHSKYNNAENDDTYCTLLVMEDKCVDELTDFIKKLNEGFGSLEELNDLMKDCVEAEVKFYR